MDTIDEEGEEETVDEEENNRYFNEYAPVIHDEANFVPTFIGDLILPEEFESYNVQGWLFCSEPLLFLNFFVYFMPFQSRFFHGSTAIVFHAIF